MFAGGIGSAGGFTGSELEKKSTHDPARGLVHPTHARTHIDTHTHTCNPETNVPSLHNHEVR